jgi:hypothetical protein
LLTLFISFLRQTLDLPLFTALAFQPDFTMSYTSHPAGFMSNFQFHAWFFKFAIDLLTKFSLADWSQKSIQNTIM